jgi:hypothetical protein
MEHGAEALEHVRKALEIDVPRLTADPNNRKKSRKVFLDYIMIANISASDSGKGLVKPGEARAGMVAGAEITDRIAAGDPTDTRALRDVRTAQEFLGDVLRREKEPEAALVHYRRALEVAQKGNPDGASGLTSREDLVMAHHRMARGLIDAGRPDEALEHLRLANVQLEGARKQSAAPTRWTAWQSDLDRARGLAYTRQKNWTAAIAAYQAAIADSEETTRKDPTNDDYWNDLRMNYFELADCYAAEGHWSDAEQALQAGLDSYRQVSTRRALRQDEEEMRQSGMSKLATWKKR